MEKSALDCFVLRDSHSDQRANHAAHSSADAGSCKSCHDGAGSDIEPPLDCLWIGIIHLGKASNCITDWNRLGQRGSRKETRDGWFRGKDRPQKRWPLCAFSVVMTVRPSNSD